MTHKEELFILACAIGVAARKGDFELVIAATKALAASVTPEDKAEADRLSVEHARECGCPICKMALEEVEHKGKTTPPDESFAV